MLNFKFWFENNINNFEDLINSTNNEILKLRSSRFNDGKKRIYFNWLKNENLLYDKKFIEYSFNLISLTQNINKDLLIFVKNLYDLKIPIQQLTSGSNLNKTQAYFNSMNDTTWDFELHDENTSNFIQWLIQPEIFNNFASIKNYIYSIYKESKALKLLNLFKGSYEDVLNKFNNEIKPKIEKKIFIPIDFNLLYNKDGTQKKQINFNLNKNEYLNVTIGETVFFKNTNENINGNILVYKIYKIEETDNKWKIIANKKFEEDAIEEEIKEEYYIDGYLHSLNNKNYNFSNSDKFAVLLFNNGKKDVNEFRYFGKYLEENYNKVIEVPQKIDVEKLLENTIKINDQSSSLGKIIINLLFNNEYFKNILKELSVLPHTKKLDLYERLPKIKEKRLLGIPRIMNYIYDGFYDKKWDSFEEFKNYINNFINEKPIAIEDYLINYFEYKNYTLDYEMAFKLDMFFKDYGEQLKSSNLDDLLDTLSVQFYSFCVINKYLDNSLLNANLLNWNSNFLFSRQQFINIIRKLENKNLQETRKELKSILKNILKKQKN